MLLLTIINDLLKAAQIKPESQSIKKCDLHLVSLVPNMCYISMVIGTSTLTLALIEQAIYLKWL